MPQFSCCARTSAVGGDGWLGAQVVDVLARDEAGLVASARCRDGRWGCVKMVRREALLRDPRRLESLRRETRALRDGGFASDRVAAFLALEADDVGVYVVAELCPGGDLATRRRRCGGAVPAADVAWYGTDLLAALDHLRTRGYAHRDVKLENCAIGTDGRAKLVGFGAVRGARFFRPDMPHSGRSTSGSRRRRAAAA